MLDSWIMAGRGSKGPSGGQPTHDVAEAKTTKKLIANLNIVAICVKIAYLFYLTVCFFLYLHFPQQFHPKSALSLSSHQNFHAASNPRVLFFLNLTVQAD